MAKQKYYVVWDGAEDGIYTSWEVCQQMVRGYSNAKYKAFKTEAEAEDAFEMGYEEWSKKSPIPPEGGSPPTPEGGGYPDGKAKAVQEGNNRTPHADALPLRGRGAVPPSGVGGLINDSIAVDAACSGNPGKMEYRGVYLRTGKEIFHFGPVWGTNNIGEFLAIVHGLALLKQKGLNDMPIYSDSVNAQLWVRKKKCKTTLERNEKTEELFKMIERAEAWLHNNTWRNQIIKWPTEEWGEIPADFGRK